jgi:hypothetical protein
LLNAVEYHLTPRRDDATDFFEMKYSCDFAAQRLALPQTLPALRRRAVA